MSDIVARLRTPPFGTETSERNLMAEAAAEIERLREADAKAIAAVPELIEALQEVRMWIDNWTPDFVQDAEWPDCDERMRAALIKAGVLEPDS